MKKISMLKDYIREFGLRLFLLRTMYKISGKFWTERMRKNYFNTFYSFFYNTCEQTLIRYVDGTMQVPTLPKYVKGKEPIWMLWWQGEKNMPPIVKACVDSVKRNANGHPVYILDKYSYTRFVTLPKFIINKQKNPGFKLAFLSDLIRLNLLEQFGGLWLDATIYVTKPIKQNVFEQDFFTLDYLDDKYCHGGIWSNFILGGKYNNIYTFCKEALYQYWQKYDLLIQYFGFDYVLLLAYRNDKTFKAIIDKRRKCSYDIYAITKNINEVYNDKLWQKILRSGTFYKIDRRQIKEKNSGIIKKILKDDNGY